MLQPLCNPSNWSLSQFPWHETTKSITNPPRQDANPAQGYPLSILPGFYSWVEKGTLRVKCLPTPLDEWVQGPIV